MVWVYFFKFLFALGHIWNYLHDCTLVMLAFCNLKKSNITHLQWLGAVISWSDIRPVVPVQNTSPDYIPRSAVECEHTTSQSSRVIQAPVCQGSGWNPGANMVLFQTEAQWVRQSLCQVQQVVRLTGTHSRTGQVPPTSDSHSVRQNQSPVLQSRVPADHRREAVVADQECGADEAEGRSRAGTSQRLWRPCG